MERRFSRQQAEQIIAMSARAVSEEAHYLTEAELVQAAEEAGISQACLKKAICEASAQEKTKEETGQLKEMGYFAAAFVTAIVMASLILTFSEFEAYAPEALRRPVDLPLPVVATPKQLYYGLQMTLVAVESVFLAKIVGSQPS